MLTAKPASIDEYIAGFPEDVRKTLQQVRAAVRKAAPGAEESISYAMPTYKLNGKVLVHFAAFKAHIGLYATPTGHAAFKKDLGSYKTGRGSVQFPLSQPMPLDLIRRIVEFRVKENKQALSKKS